MNYRDLILKLLKKRPSISIVEDYIIADFNNNDNPKAAFEKWCDLYHISIERIAGDRNITLSKSSDTAK